MRPFFSVIICTFNRAKLLPRAIESLLNQSETDWEAIVVDDGSTDKSLDIVQAYVAQDRRIRLLKHGSNRGLSTARNSGLRESSGQYITFLDSDDEYTADHLASRKEMLLDDRSIRFLHGGVRVVGDPFVIDKNDTSSTIHIDECVLGGTFVVHREVFNEMHGFDNVKYAEDTLFFELRCRRRHHDAANALSLLHLLSQRPQPANFRFCPVIQADVLTEFQAVGEGFSIGDAEVDDMSEE